MLRSFAFIRSGIIYHFPVAVYVVLVHPICAVPALGQERYGLVLRQRPRKTVDVVAQILGDHPALFVERLLGIVSYRLADRDNGVLLLEIDGIELDRFAGFAIVEPRYVDEARLQLADELGVAFGRFGKYDQIIALRQRLYALLEGLDDALIVIDGDGVGLVE